MGVRRHRLLIVLLGLAVLMAVARAQLHPYTHRGEGHSDQCAVCVVTSGVTGLLPRSASTLSPSSVMITVTRPAQSVRVHTLPLPCCLPRAPPAYAVR